MLQYNGFKAGERRQQKIKKQQFVEYFKKVLYNNKKRRTR